jgi:gliding motility-associated-like protein
VEITPSSTSANQFDVGFMNVNPLIAGYPNVNVDTSICLVNDKFYHIIGHGQGADVPAVTMLYDTLTDGAFNALGHWNGLSNRWTGTGNNTSANTASPALSTVTMTGWGNFSPKPFALGLRRPSVQLTALPGYCRFDTALVHATPGFTSYDWYLNGNLVHSGPDSVYAVNGLAANSVMQVIGHKVVDCDGYSSSIPLTVFSSSGFSAGPDVSAMYGEGVELAATGGTTYQWSPPLGLSCDTCATTIANPPNSQGYLVTTYDSNNCRLIDSVIVTINFNSSVYIPNVFSPNNDGVNDVLYVLGHGIRTMELIIFNRWGEKVFETTDQSIGWDGTFRGQVLNPAVFMYQFTAELEDKVESVVSKGSITIVR